MYKIGDKVKIVGNQSSHKFDLGTIVEILDINEKEYKCYGLDNDKNKDYWFVYKDDIAPLDYTWEDFLKAPIGTKVTFENGILVKGADLNEITSSCFVNDNYYRSYYDLRDFKDNVGSKVFGRILKIEEPDYATVYISEEIEEMTMEEICKALGKQIKIVKEKK